MMTTIVFLALMNLVLVYVIHDTNKALNRLSRMWVEKINAEWMESLAKSGAMVMVELPEEKPN